MGIEERRGAGRAGGMNRRMDDAQKFLHAIARELPADTPRPQHLIGPRTEAELAAWRDTESERRSRLDAAVRARLAGGHWPSDLDATDAWLLTLRLLGAADWLGAAKSVHLDHFQGRLVTPAMLERLLVECWEHPWLDEHLTRLRGGLYDYQAGMKAVSG